MAKSSVVLPVFRRLLARFDAIAVFCAVILERTVRPLDIARYNAKAQSHPRQVAKRRSSKRLHSPKSRGIDKLRTRDDRRSLRPRLTSPNLKKNDALLLRARRLVAAPGSVRAAVLVRGRLFLNFSLRRSRPAHLCFSPKTIDFKPIELYLIHRARIYRCLC